MWNQRPLLKEEKSLSFLVVVDVILGAQDMKVPLTDLLATSKERNIFSLDVQFCMCRDRQQAFIESYFVIDIGIFECKN